KRTSHYQFRQLHLEIDPGVFHPRYFFSSEYLADFVQRLELTGKTVAEPCTGSGLIGLVAREKGAHVSCSDIDDRAVNCATKNHAHNTKHFPETGSWRAFHSDLFDNYPPQLRFDIILVNPPYFFKPQEKPEQLAWNCGSEGEFFEKLFQQLPARIRRHSQVYIILAENCEIDRIVKIAGKYGIELNQVEERKIPKSAGINLQQN
ncbi:methyltransferase, partial [Dolichospermum circinale CS-541/06]|uniref:methyltransferase n=1 Tax=Dolichospermum circinale TaxID=109265 RepID=UPI0023306558